MKLKLSSFHLKIIAMALMTIDHIAALIFLPIFGSKSALYVSFKLIGRLSFPLFAFLIVEGMFHSRNQKKYLLRLGRFFVLMGLALWILELTKNSIGNFNFFLDLFLGASILFFLEMKKLKKLWVFIPFITYLCLCIFDASLPSYMRLGYHFYGVLLILGFYLTQKIAPSIHSLLANRYHLDSEAYENVLSKRLLSNSLALLFLVVVNLVYWMITYYVPSTDVLNASMQVVSLFSGFILLFYNGEKGYSSPRFKWACYLYYPLHLGILYIVYLII